jgi:hypothetical protein
MKKILNKLNKFLSSHGFIREANDVRRLYTEQPPLDIEEDWDIEEEERQLTPGPQDVDKIVRETNPHKGWHLPGEEVLDQEGDFSWINNDIVTNKAGRKEMNLDTITSEFISALNVASDGSQPKFVGAGVWGAVWDIGNDRYLKIYNLAVDQPTTNLTRGFVFDRVPFAEHELMVLSHGKFMDPEKVDQWTLSSPKGWKIMEKLLNIKDLGKLDSNLALDFRGFASEVRASISTLNWKDGVPSKTMAELKKKTKNEKGGSDPSLIFEVLNDPKSIEKIETIYKFVLGEATRYRHKYNRNDEDLSFNERMINGFNLDEDWIEKLVKHMIVVNITGRLDTHMGNIGLRPSTGTFVFFDA